MSGIKLTRVASGTIPTPATGKDTIFDDSTIGPAYKTDSGAVVSLIGGRGVMGQPGADGEEGDNGAPGPTGTTGPTGATGPTGGAAQLASTVAASAAIAATETVVVSASLTAGYLTAGKSFRIRAAGVGTTGATPGSDIFRIRIGPTTLTGTIPTSVTTLGIAVVTAQPFDFEAIVTLRTSGAGGTIIGECVVQADNVASGRYAVLNSLSATVATVAVDTTVANLLELTYISGNAGSSNTFHVAEIEVLSSGPAGGGPGSELSYVAFTSDTSITATTEATANTVVTAAPVTFDGSTVVMVEFFCSTIEADLVLGRSISVYLYDGAASIGRLTAVISQTTTSNRYPTFLAHRLTPSAASHTYSIRASVSAGAGTVSGGAGGVGNVMPGFIRITRI